MSRSDTSQSSGNRGASPADTQNLVGLLDSLVPLLLRLQAQTAQSFPYPPPDPAIQSAILDHQAAVAFTDDIIAEALRNVTAYVQEHERRNKALEPFGDVITQAKQAFAARDYARALALILQVYRGVAALRAVNAELPAIGKGASFREASLH
jgi:hypothetical protein